MFVCCDYGSLIIFPDCWKPRKRWNQPALPDDRRGFHRRLCLVSILSGKYQFSTVCSTEHWSITIDKCRKSGARQLLLWWQVLRWDSWRPLLTKNIRWKPFRKHTQMCSVTKEGHVANLFSLWCKVAPTSFRQVSFVFIRLNVPCLNWRGLYFLTKMHFPFSFANSWWHQIIVDICLAHPILVTVLSA